MKEALKVAWENSRHFATTPLVSSRNGAWEKGAEIPCWLSVPTKVWSVLLISNVAWETCFSPQIWVATRHHHGISALVLQTPFRGNQKWRWEMTAAFCLTAKPIIKSWGSGYSSQQLSWKNVWLCIRWKTQTLSWLRHTFSPKNVSLLGSRF